MTNLTHYEIITILNGVQNNQDISGWQTLKVFNNHPLNKDFTFKVYKRNDTIVIAMAGAQNHNDRINAGIIMSTKNIPPQYWDAKNLYYAVANKYKEYNIEFVGYSLGATLANLLSHHTGLPSTALAPIGSKHIAQMNPYEFNLHEQEIMVQLNTIGIPTNSNMRQSSLTGNVIYVHPYIRSNGTRVKGYWRSKALAS